MTSIPLSYFVIVLNCNGAAVQGASVVLDATQGTTDVTGALSFSVIETTNATHILAITHPYYVAERVEFRGTLSAGQFNNALLTRTSDTGRMMLTVRIGRLEVAPTALK